MLLEWLLSTTSAFKLYLFSGKNVLLSSLLKLGENKYTSAYSESSVFSASKKKFLPLNPLVDEPCKPALN
mgnify:CR=1 FL=1